MKLSEIIKTKESDYPEAGENAPPEVQQAVERWKELPEEEKENQPLLYWLLGSGTPDYKMSQEDSQYVDDSEVEGQYCSNCEYLYLKIANKKFICSQIRDRVQPGGWCKLWKKGLR